MDIGKSSNNSDASSPENDHQSEKSNEDNTGVGRSYECTFCKRGFTNAQALGGHMNIHRKDKAKATHKNQEDHSKKRNENHPNFRYYSSQISSSDHHHHHHHHYNQMHQYQQQQSSYHGAIGGQVNYQVYLPSSNPNIQTGNYLPLWRSESHVDANLSLGIGVTPSVDDDGNVKGNEVDLELRLGHDP